MASAPTGYMNRTTEDGRRYIAPREPAASIMKWAFQELARGKYPVDQVWKVCKKKGLSTGRNNFHNLVRNPVYCGKIVVPAYKDEPLQWAEGQHEPLITEELFNKVQRVLSGRIVKRGVKVVSPEKLYLRGFLKCPRCTRMLSGSASRGCRAYYHYYHCSDYNGGMNSQRAILDKIRELTEKIIRARDMAQATRNVQDNLEKAFAKMGEVYDNYMTRDTQTQDH